MDLLPPSFSASDFESAHYSNACAKVTCIEADLAQRRRRHGHQRAVRRDRDAIREGDVRRDGGVHVGRRRNRYVSCPAQREGKNRLDKR